MTVRPEAAIGKDPRVVQFPTVLRLQQLKIAHGNREIEQFYDPVENTFLADRFIRGTCPFCKTPDQYGGECENCLRSYAATELIAPRSDFSGATPVRSQTVRSIPRLA